MALFKPEIQSKYSWLKTNNNNKKTPDVLIAASTILFTKHLSNAYSLPDACKMPYK